MLTMEEANALRLMAAHAREAAIVSAAATIAWKHMKTVGMDTAARRGIASSLYKVHKEAILEEQLAATNLNHFIRSLTNSTEEV